MKVYAVATVLKKISSKFDLNKNFRVTKHGACVQMEVISRITNYIIQVCAIG